MTDAQVRIEALEARIVALTSELHDARGMVENAYKDGFAQGYDVQSMASMTQDCEFWWKRSVARQRLYPTPETTAEMVYRGALDPRRGSS